MDLHILYEDAYIVCVAKPNNLVVHHAHHSRNVTDETSLVQLVNEHFESKCHPIHRLDRKTSGVVVFAKSNEYVAPFQQLFTSHAIQKIYYGIVRGHAPAKKTIDSPVKGRDAKVYKDAETQLELLNTTVLDIPVKPYPSSRYSLVKLLPKTGRLHQLRIHCNKISYPLIGDPKYGDNNHNQMFETQFQCSKLFLHAYQLHFQHPFTDEKIVITAPFPDDWLRIGKHFDWSELQS